MYCSSAYYLSKMVLELPVGTALSFVFGLLGYVMVGMNMDRYVACEAASPYANADAARGRTGQERVVAAMLEHV